MKNEKNEEKSISSQPNNQMKEKELKDDVDIINLLKIIDINSKDINYLFIKLNEFEEELKSLKNLNYLLNYEIFEILKKLNEKDNIRINLILCKIFLNIINKESLYTKFLLEFNEDKINLIIQIIEESVSLIKKLNGFIFDSNIFKLKIKILSLTKFTYLNHKSNLNKTSAKKFEDLLYTIPSLFFSEEYNELNKDKEYLEIYKNFDMVKMRTFEDKFTRINNYFEQFDVFNSFVQYNTGVISYAKVTGEENQEMEKKKFIKKCMNALNKIEFYQQYGLLLLKFCLYHKYIFLLKEDETKGKNKDEGNEISKVVFLLDQVIDEENKGKKVNEKQINELMNKKLFVAVTESKEYNELIKKEINNYLNLIKKAENDEKFKQIVWQLKYFLSIINEESYVPLYLSDLSKITFNDNFSPFYLLNVPARASTELYLETNINETMLLNIEFYLEDKTKDITFEVKKYDINNNIFKNIIKEEKIFNAFKFFVLCNGYCLYQIVFNNSYSWFHSKDINYRISLLQAIDKNKTKTNLNENLNKEKEKKEEKQNIIEENKIKQEINKQKKIENSNVVEKGKANKKEEINLDGKKDKKTEDKDKDKKKERENEKDNKQIQEKEMIIQEKKEDKLEKTKENKIEGKKVEIKEKDKEKKKEEKKGQKIEIIEKIIEKKNVNQKKNIKDKKIDENKEKQKENTKKNFEIKEDIKIETKIDEKEGKKEVKKEEKKEETKEEKREEKKEDKKEAKKEDIKKKKIEQNMNTKEDIQIEVKTNKKEEKEEEINKKEKKLEKKEEIYEKEEKKRNERGEIKKEKIVDKILDKKEEIKKEKNEKLTKEKKEVNNILEKIDEEKEKIKQEKKSERKEVKGEKKINEKIDKNEDMIKKKEEQNIKNLAIKVKEEDIIKDNLNGVLLIKTKDHVEEQKVKNDEIKIKKDNKEDDLNAVLLIKKKNHKDEQKEEINKEKRKEVVNVEKSTKKIEENKEKEKEKGIDKKKKDEVKKEQEKRKEELNKNKKEKIEEKKFNCFIHGKNICFDINKINKRIKDFDDIIQDEIFINIPIMLYLNNLTFVSVKKDIVKFIEKINEDEKTIVKSFFDFQIINYLQKNLKLKAKDAQNKKILITLFNQNREISLSEENKERVIIWKDSKKRDLKEQAKYLEKIGFYPSQTLEGYNIEYNLYDLCEQGLLYHLILSKEKNIKIEKSLYFINFDKKVVNAAIFSKGQILTKLGDEYEKSKLNYFNNINISDHNQFLLMLEKVNNTFKGIDLILTYFDNNDKNEINKLFKLFDVIRIHCKKNVNPPIDVTIYSQNEIYNNVFNYSILFYDN